MGPQPQHRQSRGFSLVELLIVVTVLGILAVVGVNMIGNRQAAAVRSLMDEMDGALSNARQVAAATGRDVAVDCWGNWTAATPLTIAYGDASFTPATLQGYAVNLLASQPPPQGLAYGQTIAVPFQYHAHDPTHSRARIVLSGSGDWATAMTATSAGNANQDITTLDPFLAGDPLGTALGALIQAGTPTFTGVLQQSAVISGSTQRFNTSLIIEIVGTSPDNGPIPGGPMGLLVALANGSTVYRFYNPGYAEGDGQWRKM